VDYSAALVGFVQESRVDQRTRVLGYSFEVCPEFVGNFSYVNPLVFLHDKKDRDAPMVCRPLEMSFELLRRFPHI